MREISEKDFKEAVSASGVVLVDCHADWCMPCKALKPILQKVEAANLGLTVVGLNVDENPTLAAELGIRGVPALFWYKDGKLAVKELGLRKEAMIIETLEKVKGHQ